MRLLSVRNEWQALACSVEKICVAKGKESVARLVITPGQFVVETKRSQNESELEPELKETRREVKMANQLDTDKKRRWWMQKCKTLSERDSGRVRGGERG